MLRRRPLVRSTFAGLLTAVALFAVSSRVAAQSPPAVPASLSAAEATALVGSWTITADGMQGPTTMTLVFAMEDEKLSAEMQSAEMGATPISSIAKDGESVVLHYEFDYQGMMVPTTVWLTPVADQKEVYTAGLDFANGGYYMEGKAERAQAE